MTEQTEREVLEAEHRWSGWPGAWCLDCGASDPYEDALADGRIDDDHDTGLPIITDALRAELAPQMICPEPGSKRHDPYAARAAIRAAKDAAP